MKKILLIISLISLILSCSKESEAVGGYGLSEKKMEFEADSNVSGSDNLKLKKIIKEGWFTFESNNLKKSKVVISEAVKKYDGYISSDKEDRYGDRVTNRVIIKVPSKEFDNLVIEISKGVKSVDRKEISLRDVTEEYIDIESRLKNKRVLEHRYLDLLKRADSVLQMLEVERELNKLRSDIESIEGRLKYLKHSISFSTIDLTIYEVSAKKMLFGSRFIKGLKNGWSNFITFLLFLVNIWPFLIIITGIAFFIRFLRKRYGKRSG